MKISLKSGAQGPISNIPALVQIRAWRRPGDKLLSEPMMFSLLTHICVTRPQWVYASLVGVTMPFGGANETILNDFNILSGKM